MHFSTIVFFFLFSILCLNSEFAQILWFLYSFPLSCQCNAGYEGSGTQCTEIDPCSKPNQGSCHHEAVCTKTGPGTNNCTCGVGFRGDGISCVPIDPCLEMGGGYCHSNAECQYVSPGQVSLCPKTFVNKPICKRPYLVLQAQALPCFTFLQESNDLIWAKF